MPRGFSLEHDITSPYVGWWVDGDTRQPTHQWIISQEVAYLSGEKRERQMPEQPGFEIIAQIPTAKDHDKSLVPPWSDLVLQINRQDGNPGTAIALTRNAGEALLEAVHSALHPWAAQNILATIWEDLDATTDRLASGEADEHDVGRAQGLAYALAVITNPYAPNVDAIKALAMERAGLGEDEDDETDEMWDELMALDMLALRQLAAEVQEAGHLPKSVKWRSLGHDDLVALLWQHDISAQGKATVEEATDEDDWGDGL